MQELSLICIYAIPVAMWKKKILRHRRRRRKLPEEENGNVAVWIGYDWIY